ncbi:MAG TPA: hypothetical protein PLX07_10555, partial [Microthrixaceae bacterium]|nr:hypothetical protein [Microthrixaceae bacterium]
MRPSVVRTTAPTHGFGDVAHRTVAAAASARVMHSRSTASWGPGGRGPSVGVGAFIGIGPDRPVRLCIDGPTVEP